MVSLVVFTRRIKALAGRVEKNVNETVIKTALAVDQTVVLATPVDTGQARGGWQASVGSPILKTTERVDKGGSTTIAANKSKIEARRLGQDIFISNNLPYIGRLNEGSSAQAPAGFVEMAVEEAQAVVARAKVVK